MHQDKLTAIVESRENNKFNAVPHKKEAAVIMKHIQKRRARNDKQHHTETVYKNA
jgi:hypothetical protein